MIAPCAWAEQRGNVWWVRVKAVPGARQTRIAGVLGDHLKIQVSAPPEDGRANESLREILAEWAQIPASSVRLLQGHTRPRKVFELSCPHLPVLS
jgi:uncharacterized protein YggU (UPF0235/DUF167 family)